MNAPDTTYRRAIAAYDADHELALLQAITAAIAEALMVSDANAIAIRTAELTGALLTALASTLALSPAVTRSPTSIRHTIDELHKRLRRRLAQAERDPAVQDFIRRCFHGDVDGGHA